ncbi:hypothetical protein ACFLSQ_09800 [Bacteroidota bacterium]
MKFTLLLTLIFSIVFLNIPANVIAQDEEDSEIWDGSFWDDDFESSFSIKHPTVELKYGMGEPSIHKDLFSSKFEKVNSVEARFGFMTKKEKLFENTVFEYTFNYFFLGNITSDWNKTNEANSVRINTDAWQWGFGFSKGYGYKFGEKTDLVLYSTGALAWTSIDFLDTSATIPIENADMDNAKMDYFGDNFRFGDYFEGGIKFQVYEPLAFTVGYQRGIVLPRHMFWKWLGGGIVEGIGEGIISWFSDEVVESSPTFGPIVYFVLKNAYSYGIYELRKKRMNWPFDTEAPLMYENFKVGMSFGF